MTWLNQYFFITSFLGRNISQNQIVDWTIATNFKLGHQVVTFQMDMDRDFVATLENVL